MERKSGILLHITSLPGGFGVGDLGPGAYRFVDFLHKGGQRLWQILPLNPTDPGHGNSPYHSQSSFASNPLLISPELLLRDGLLDPGDLPLPEGFPEGRAAYEEAGRSKGRLLHKAWERFRSRGPGDDFEDFRRDETYWLEDFALFTALKSRLGGKPWYAWPEELRDRRAEALESARRELAEEMDRIRFFQYIFSKQWQAVRAYSKEHGVDIMGDVPIYVVHDSADVWVHPEIFKLDEDKRPMAVAGVPPDYFSETGQLWGNPVYRWETLRESGYQWWIDRIRRNMGLFDCIRIDHFRGFMGYWEIQAGERTAMNGRWVEAPGREFFEAVMREVPEATIIAEDLGVITSDVHEVMDHFGFPGMKVLLFAFGPDLSTNPYAPHRHVRNCVVYTGTHDNNTVRGWFENETTVEQRKRLSAYVGREITFSDVHLELVRLAMMSVADTCVLPMPDVLGLGEEHRMNRPATSRGNWLWRLAPAALDHAPFSRLRSMAEIYGRI